MASCTVAARETSRAGNETRVTQRRLRSWLWRITCLAMPTERSVTELVIQQAGWSTMKLSGGPLDPSSSVDVSRWVEFLTLDSQFHPGRVPGPDCHPPKSLQHRSANQDAAWIHIDIRERRERRESYNSHVASGPLEISML